MINLKFALMSFIIGDNTGTKKVQDRFFFLLWFIEKGTALVFRREVNVESRGDTLHHALFIYSSYKTWHITSNLRHSTYNRFRYSSFRNSCVVALMM